MTVTGTVVICDYGAGNIRSLASALGRIGFTPLITGEADIVAEAPCAVLPGVGSARTAMEALRPSKLGDALRHRVERGLPTLGICLGMQLGVEASDEDGGVICLGIVPGRCVRLRQPRVPRMGWALVEPWNEVMYFAHSYAVESPASIAQSDGICAAIATGSFLGVQFHPEKSGRAGERFLQRWLSPV
jgi:glutamine amidotransferase